VVDDKGKLGAVLYNILQWPRRVAFEFVPGTSSDTQIVITRSGLADNWADKKINGTGNQFDIVGELVVYACCLFSI
jgi:hypothetical protein